MRIVFPQNLNCTVCDMPISRKNKYGLCRFCYENMIIINKPCEVCGKPIINLALEENSFDCGFCSGKKFLFDRNISFVEYGNISKELVFKLKYSSKTYIAKTVSEIMYDQIKNEYEEELKDFDFITYVPLGRKREKERGFNQSKKIAEYLSEKVSIQSIGMLRRTKNTKKMHLLGYDDRKRELKNAFEILEDKKECVEGRKILVVDDIFTSGATIDEIAKVLKIAGAENVTSLTFLTGKYVKPVEI